ncbi:uncharacterized protein [Haliotis asinina]|uniref:uncharacterized protein n=1 Tax=Haliotis asinina TaxID=109174 RepID=UPI003531B311
MSLAPVPIKYNTLIPWIDVYYAVCSKDADLLRVGFTSGFNLQFTGSFTPNNAPNLRSARQFPQIVNTKLQKEISLGRIAGPFPSCPIQNLKVSPVGLVKKKSDTSSVTTIADNYRLIHHLSHPRGSSVNDGISAEFCSVQYSRFDEAVSLVQQLGKGAQLAKFDVKSAFRLLPVRPEDFHLLGMYFEGNYYFDKCLPFGCSISCALFETFSRFLQWCINKHTHSASIMHYLDDFLVGGRAQSGTCKYLLDSSIQLFRHFGIPIAQEKTVQPTTTIKFLGITIDTISMEIRIPPEKINHLCQEIVALLQSQKRKLKVHQLQSLLGKLYFVCRAVRCGRAFCRRLTDALCGNVYPYHRIRLTNDLAWVIGDSYMARAKGSLEQRLQCLGRTRWQVRGGRRWSHFRASLNSLLASASNTSPKWLVIHLGSNDLSQTSARSIYEDIMCDLLYAKLRMPDTRLVWSFMLPRVAWPAAMDIKKLELSRKKLNRRLSNRIYELHGISVRHDQFDPVKCGPEHYLADGVHLSTTAMDIFVHNIVSALTAS